MLFSQNGTLVGLPITITVLGSLGPVAQYTEIHNLSQANTFSCVSNNVTFIIPPLRKLVLTESTQQITLTGTGDYIVLANSVSQGNAAGPALEPTLYGTGGLVSVSPADGVTIEDTGTVIRVKDGGISSAKLAPLAVTTDKINLLAVDTAQLANLGVSTAKLADYSVTTDKLAALAVTWRKINSGSTSAGTPGSSAFLFLANPADGETITVEYGTSLVYEFDNGGGVAPGNIAVTIGAGTAATVINLLAAIQFNQANVHPVLLTAAVDSLGIVGNSQAYTLSGEPLTLLGSASVAVYNAKAAAGEYKQGVVGATYTIDANDAAVGSVIFGVGGLVESYQVQVFTTTGKVKAFDGGVYVSGPAIQVSNFGAAVPFVLGDVITLSAIVNY